MKTLRNFAVLLVVSQAVPGCAEEVVSRAVDGECADADVRIRECADYRDSEDLVSNCRSGLEACVADCVLAEPEGGCEDIAALYDYGYYQSEVGWCVTVCFRDHTESSGEVSL